MNTASQIMSALIDPTEAQLVRPGDVLYLAEDTNFSGALLSASVSVQPFDGVFSAEHPRLVSVDERARTITYATGMAAALTPPVESAGGELVVQVRLVDPATPPAFIETELDDLVTGLPVLRAA